ncbi:ribonuclease HII [Eubacterium sp. 1001713B170207_170306_E7]|uniref:ribonuclease HII n=1 Tax=Eubacterium sp. 1001713B170207_170306_E7 TaxID=2787097 RepID=UPI00189A86BB|nr:ribonuclease HII [Eubacterium sp. 1001713B170207_170306_E7]
MTSVNPEQIANMTAKAVKELWQSADINEYPALAQILSQDSRAVIKKQAQTLKRYYDKHCAILEKTARMKAFELQCYDEGYQIIGGSDEVGRGPLAGPVVCAAVILPKDSAIMYVDDSKKLSAKMREALDRQIRAEALSITVGLRTPEQIDAMNILEATKSAMSEAISQLDPQPELMLIDALTIEAQTEVRSIIHGDATCYSIAAASIVAKVYRDRLMHEYHAQYPEYGFDRNVGYGTAEHIAAIKKYGLTPIHRRSFVQNFV